MRGATILLAAILAACSGGGAATTTGPTGPTGPTVAGGGDDAGAGAIAEAPGERDVVGTPAAPPPRPIDRDECGQLVDRMIAVEVAEQRAQDPKAPQLTAEQQAQIRARLLAQAEPTCSRMSRATWECAVAAADRDAMAACDADGP